MALDPSQQTGTSRDNRTATQRFFDSPLGKSYQDWYHQASQAASRAAQIQRGLSAHPANFGASGANLSRGRHFTGSNQSQVAAIVSGASARQQRAAATSAARAAATRAARKVTPATITKLPQGVKGPGFTPFKGTDFNIRDNVYAAARSGRLRTVSDIKRAASNIENATFRTKVIAKAQRLALAAIRAGR
jgi:hypothetical protein